MLWMRISDYVWHKFLKRPYTLEKVIDQGSGKNLVILIHGLGGRAQQWEPLIDTFSGSAYRLVAYDLLGFGSSPKPDFVEYSVEEHVKSLLKSIRGDFNNNQKFILVGHSMGCIIATHLAYKKPKIVKSVLLYEPPLIIGSDKKILLRKYFYNYVAGRPGLVASYLRIANKFTHKFSSFTKSNASDEQWLPFERSLKNTIIAQNTVDELQNIQPTTHIVYGRLDFVVSKVDAKRMAKINPKIKLHYVTEIHDITQKSSKFLKNIIESV